MPLGVVTSNDRGEKRVRVGIGVRDHDGSVSGFEWKSILHAADAWNRTPTARATRRIVSRLGLPILAERLVQALAAQA